MLESILSLGFPLNKKIKKKKKTERARERKDILDWAMILKLVINIL